MLWTDAIFIKNFTKFDQFSEEDLKKTALILNDLYGSIDIVLRALMAFDAKANSDIAKEYLEYLA